MMNPRFVLHTALSSMLLLFSFGGQAAPHPYAIEQHILEPQVFAQNIVSTNAFEINTVFDETGRNVIFSRCKNDFSFCTLFESNYRDDQWQSPTPLSFSEQYFDADPYYTPDFTTLYFISKRPIANGTEATEFFNLWRVSKDAQGMWGEPEYLPELSAPVHDLYPSITQQNTLYFSSYRDKTSQLYQVEIGDNGFSTPQPVNADMYGDNARVGDVVVLKDGKTAILSINGREDGQGRGDLYVSYWVDEKWTLATPLKGKINTPNHEFTPIVSPDGNYLFFTRIENGVGNLYQISLSEVFAK